MTPWRVIRDEPMPLGKKPSNCPEVGDGGGVTGGAEAEGEDAQADHDHADQGGDLDHREPELQLAEELHGDQVDPEEDHQEDQGGDPLRDGREPVVDVDRGGRQFGHAGDDPHQPVRPAGEVAEERAEELAGVLREGARDRAVEEQFAERPHDEEDDHAREGVHEDEAGAGLGDVRPGAQEEADADGAADRDHLDLAAAEPALVPLFGALCGPIRVDLSGGHMCVRLSPCRTGPFVGLGSVLDPPGWMELGGLRGLARAWPAIRRLGGAPGGTWVVFAGRS